MPADLQGLVDRLGHVLQRSVAVDDTDLRIIVYSDHYGDEDPARMQALVGRGAAGHMIDYLAGHRINTWCEPRYMDADESLGLKRRLVIPLWSGQTLLGFVWIIVGGGLKPGELEVSVETSKEIAGILARRADRQADEELRKSSLIRDLLAGGPAVRKNAAFSLGEERPFAVAGGFTALLILRTATVEPGSEAGRTPGRDAVGRAMATRPRDGYGLAVIEGGTAVLLGTRSPLGPVETADLGRRILRELHIQGEQEHAGAVVGAGATVAGLEKAFSSLDQAKVAARAALAGGLESATWDVLGSSALLPALVGRPVEGHLVPEGFVSMMAGLSAEMLRLVEVYLEVAGNAADTAERLHMHRSSVYYNLGQFQKSTGWDLRDGNARFYLHLWLKARKLDIFDDIDGPALPEGTTT